MNEVIEARDFSIVIEELPASFKQYTDELSLKVAIWKMIQDKLHQCKEHSQSLKD